MISPYEKWRKKKFFHYLIYPDIESYEENTNPYPKWLKPLPELKVWAQHAFVISSLSFYAFVFFLFIILFLF